MLLLIINFCSSGIVSWFLLLSFEFLFNLVERIFWFAYHRKLPHLDHQFNHKKIVVSRSRNLEESIFFLFWFPFFSSFLIFIIIFFCFVWLRVDTQELHFRNPKFALNLSIAQIDKVGCEKNRNFLLFFSFESSWN